MSSVVRGAIIAIEGVDRVGKTTLANRLVQSLTSSGRPAEYIRFPDRNTPVGALISSYLSKGSDLDDHAIHLLFSANRWEWHEKIRSTLLSGTSLVVDRYAYSGVAYSAAKGKMSVDWCKNSDAGLVAADAVFYLTLDQHDELESRNGFGDEKYETNQFQAKARDAYSQIRSDNWITFKTDSLSVDEVHDLLFHRAKDVIDSSSNQELSYLW